MTDFVYNQHLSQRELIGAKTTGTATQNRTKAEYDPHCPAWLRFAEPETTFATFATATTTKRQAHTENKPTRSKSYKHNTRGDNLHPQISLPTSNPNFRNVQRSVSLRDHSSSSKRKPEKLSLTPSKFPQSIHGRQQHAGQISSTPKPNIKLPELPKSDNQHHQHHHETSYKKVNSPMRTDFFNHHEPTNDAKFQYQQQIIEFLTYTIGKYKQLETFMETSKLEWNATSEKSLVLLNLRRIKDGFKDLITTVLKQLSKQSGIINQSEVTEDELINCNVFQFVYNCSIEAINLGDLINSSGIFNNLFKFSLLSYYLRLSFVIEQEIYFRDQLAIPMEVWHKLPTFIKSIKDQLVKLNNHNIKMGINNGVKRNFQDLEICLVKLNSVTSKFTIVDNMKTKHPITRWTDLYKTDEILKARVPEYYPQHYLMHENGGNAYSLQFVDFNNRPLSTAVDTNIVNGLHSNYKIDAKLTAKKEVGARDRLKKSHENEAKQTVSRATSIKRSLSSMVKRSVSTSDSSEKTKPNKLNALADFFVPSAESQPKQHLSRSPSQSQNTKTAKSPQSKQHLSRSKSQAIGATRTTTPKQQQEVYPTTPPPRRNQSLRENKDLLDITDEDESPSDSKLTTRSPSKKDILIMLKNRPLPSEPESPVQHKTKQEVDKVQKPQVQNPQVQNYINCLLQLRKKLTALGPQLIEFFEIQLKYCQLWQKFLENESSHNSNHNKDPFIKSICQSFYEKLLHQISFTQHTIVRHINAKLIMPIDECLQLYRNVNDSSYIHQFMELIVRQYNKLYCDWLEGIIGAQSIAEYQQLCERMQSCPGMKKGDDIVEYYEQLTKLKNLVV
ncbi:FAV1 [Candida margitis]|uniref:FAV1 n=1 Tax=Candida margitis TaxID=1775924 RepID=UPI0022265FF6|nr:FAV1 [Candida margitis]KAI5970308.1 FAV1 [Candida margitis]